MMALPDLTKKINNNRRILDYGAFGAITI
ncbi:hypothetical protein KvSKV_00110 [Ketogulonicigenium vulgare]|nr:hypothetical protein KvSKV_00110 [Ketogulonicigenium vulgare]